MKKLLIIIGTRPEAIKTAPVIKTLEEEYKDVFEYKLISTGQHDTMLNRVLDFYNITPDYELRLMRDNQELSELTANLMNSLDEIVKQEKPDVVLVQGDTTTAFVGALVSFYNRAKVGHIEAGLRTYNKFNPFPEEINRHFIDIICDFYFAPTRTNYENLLNEDVPEDKIFITGNTIVDALNEIEKRDLKFEFNQIDPDKKIVLITAHRRENFGKGIKNICKAILHLARQFTDYQFVYPVHKNPNIIEVVERKLKNQKNIVLLEPLGYLEFINLMVNSEVILTDSGGVQEEATTLNIPTVVLREVSERIEGIESDILKISGTKVKDIVNITKALIENRNNYKDSDNNVAVYGKGDASKKILDILEKQL